MSYDIKLEGIITNGKHGVYESEKIEQQLFLIDLVITLANETVKDDSIESTIDYEQYVEQVEYIVSSCPAAASPIPGQASIGITSSTTNHAINAAIPGTKNIMLVT